MEGCVNDHLDEATDFMQTAGVSETDIENVMKRLRKAAKQYGDESYDRPTPALLNEIEQEAQDLVGWPFILHRKMQMLLEGRCSASTRQYAEAVQKAMVLVAADAGVMLEHIRELKAQFA